ncbi:uncharacterized protein [Nothobranchius furzeri]|uniref:uncharacterized protein n=1 Tax=Nothobranchius furzeri TaxID=105023 RepID=UPI0039047F89
METTQSLSWFEIVERGVKVNYDEIIDSSLNTEVQVSEVHPKASLPTNCGTQGTDQQESGEKLQKPACSQDIRSQYYRRETNQYQPSVSSQDIRSQYYRRETNQYQPSVSTQDIRSQYYRRETNQYQPSVSTQDIRSQYYRRETPQQKRPTMIRLKGCRKGTDSGPKSVSEPPKTASTIKSEQPRTPVIWMIGSSYIRRGEKAAQQQFGPNFGLRAKVQWFGKGGMGWGGVLPRFYSEARTHGPPDILVVHAGGNDLGHVSPGELASQIQKDLSHLHKDFPEMRIAFSAINERQSWGYGQPGRINNNRKQVNSSLRRAVKSFGGLVIEHPEVRFFNNALFLPDRVHFSKRGNSLFLGSIHSVLEKVLAQRCNT